MTTLPAAWACYARVQRDADRFQISNRYWATDEAADVALDLIARCDVTANVISERLHNLVANRAAKHRRRSQILHDEIAPLASMDAYPSVESEVVARSELSRVYHSVRSDDWRLLTDLAEGQSYAELARERNENVSALKMRVSRLRRSLLN